MCKVPSCRQASECSEYRFLQPASLPAPCTCVHYQTLDLRWNIYITLHYITLHYIHCGLYIIWNYGEGEELHGLAVAILIFAQLPTFVYLSCRKALFANLCIAFHAEFSFVFLYPVLFVILQYRLSLRFLLRFHNSLLRPLPKIEKVGCENFIHFYALILWQLRRAPFLQILWLTSQCFWKTWIFIHTSTWSLAQHLETLHIRIFHIFTNINHSWKKRKKITESSREKKHRSNNSNFPKIAWNTSNNMFDHP